MGMVGQNIGKYRVLDRIGRGGMGTVYRATDETLHREVAIKVLNAELNDPGVARRFRAEAVTVARLSHPGLATIYELFQHDGQWLMVMEFVRGETLEALVSRAGPLAVEVAAPLCMQALNALAHAHSMGVVHRDLKPANIMVNEAGLVKVMDFGIARVAGTEHLTSAGFLMGTPAYMAPEQVTAGEVDARADLYAIGVVFYHLLTGVLPFKGTTPFEMAQSRISDTPTPVRTVRADLPEWVEQVMNIALARTPAARYQSAPLFHEALRRGLAHLPLDTPQEPTVRPELIATALPGTLPAIMAAGPTGAASPSSIVRADLTATQRPAPGGVAPASTGLGPVAMTPASGSMAPAAPSATAPSPGPAAPSADRTAAARLPDATVSRPDGATTGAATRGTPRVAVIGLAAAVVLVAALGAWFWPRPGPDAASPAETPPVAVTPPPAADQAVPEISPAPPTTATGAAAEPGGTTLPAAGTAPGGTTPSLGTVTPGLPGAAGTTPGTTPRRRTAPADPRLAFEDVRVIVITARRSEELDATLVFGGGQLVVASRKDGTALATLRYDTLSRATYVRGRNPRWDAGLPGPAADVDFPGGLFRGARHWIALQSASAFVILRLSDVTWRQVVEAVTARTGLPVRQASDGQ